MKSALWRVSTNLSGRPSTGDFERSQSRSGKYVAQQDNQKWTWLIRMKFVLDSTELYVLRSGLTSFVYVMFIDGKKLQRRLPKNWFVDVQND